MSELPRPLTRPQLRRLREVYRSAGWPCLDGLELELLALGLLESVPQGDGRSLVRLTAAGLQAAGGGVQQQRRMHSPHERLVRRMALELLRGGRIVWTGLGLRARVEAPTPAAAQAPAETGWRWCMPDVFSVRNTSVEAYLEPVVHEVKVQRADLLADLREPAKRQAYLEVGGQCWYVLGCDSRGRPIAEPDEIPAECGVLQSQDDRLDVLRPAPRRACERLPFAVWMALARAAPLALDDLEDSQGTQARW